MPATPLSFSFTALANVVGLDMAETVSRHHRTLQNRESARKRRMLKSNQPYKAPIVLPRNELYIHILKDLESADAARSTTYQHAADKLRRRFGMQSLERSMIEVLLQYGSLYDLHIKR